MPGMFDLAQICFDCLGYKLLFARVSLLTTRAKNAAGSKNAATQPTAKTILA